MTSNKADQLIQCFQIEISLLQSLIEILQKEKDLLTNRSFADLESIAQQKEELSSQLESHTKERLHILNIESTPKAARTQLQAFLQECSEMERTQIQQLNEQLTELLNLCREQNTVNGQVITANIHLRKDIIDSLSGKQSQSATNRYTATGNLDSNGESTRHQEA